MFWWYSIKVNRTWSLLFLFQLKIALLIGSQGPRTPQSSSSASPRNLMWYVWAHRVFFESALSAQASILMRNMPKLRALHSPMPRTSAYNQSRSCICSSTWYYLSRRELKEVNTSPSQTDAYLIYFSQHLWGRDWELTTVLGTIVDTKGQEHDGQYRGSWFKPCPSVIYQVMSLWQIIAPLWAPVSSFVQKQGAGRHDP